MHKIVSRMLIMALLHAGLVQGMGHDISDKFNNVLKPLEISLPEYQTITPKIIENNSIDKIIPCEVTINFPSQNCVEFTVFYNEDFFVKSSDVLQNVAITHAVIDALAKNKQADRLITSALRNDIERLRKYNENIKDAERKQGNNKMSIFALPINEQQMTAKVWYAKCISNLKEFMWLKTVDLAAQKCTANLAAQKCTAVDCDAVNNQKKAIKFDYMKKIVDTCTDKSSNAYEAGVQYQSKINDEVLDKDYEIYTRNHAHKVEDGIATVLLLPGDNKILVSRLKCTNVEDSCCTVNSIYEYQKSIDCGVLVDLEFKNPKYNQCRDHVVAAGTINALIQRHPCHYLNRANPDKQTSLQKEVDNLLTLSLIRSSMSSCLRWFGRITACTTVATGAGAVGAYQAKDIKATAAFGAGALLSGLATCLCFSSANTKHNEAIMAKAQVLPAIVHEYSVAYVDEQQRPAFVQQMKDYQVNKPTNAAGKENRIAKEAVESYYAKRNPSKSSVTSPVECWREENT